MEEFKNERGFRTFSEALRFIIDDYFKLRQQLDEARDADFSKVCELIAGKGGSGFNQAVIEDLDELKGAMNEVKNMLLVVGSADDKLKAQFAEYFPQYFEERK